MGVRNTTSQSEGDAQKEPFQVFYDQACPICGSPAPGDLVGEVREHEYITTDMTFPVYSCPECQLVYLYPRPDVSELSTIYPDDYYSNHMAMNAPVEGGGNRSFVQRLFFEIHLKNYRQRIIPFISTPSEPRPLRILDVGCGVGAQLDALKSLLPDSETHGVEMGRIAASKARARGHVVYEGRFEDLDMPLAYFDVIMSVHVIEHVARPDLFLEKCLSLLTPGGIAMIETPNTDCLDFQLFKRRHWGGYHAPRHWYLFRKETFEHLARRFGCELVRAEAYTMSNFWSWSAHSVLMDLAGRKTADLLFPPVKILYGGWQSFFILSGFALWERLLLKLTGKACSIWTVFRKSV